MKQIDINKNAAKLKRAMDRISEIETEVRLNNHDLTGWDYNYIIRSLNRALIELGEAKIQFEKIESFKKDKL